MSALFTEEQVKNGEYAYWRAKTFIEKMDDALKTEGESIDDLPQDVRASYEKSKKIVEDHDHPS